MSLRVLLFILLSLSIVLHNVDLSAISKHNLIPIKELPQEHTGNEKIQKIVMTYLNDAKNKARFNGIILVANKEQPLYSAIIGYRDYEHHTPLNMEDHFRIGSISKQFTGTIIMQLIEEGKVNPNAYVKEYLPELNYPWTDKVKIEHLLRHRSGLEELDEPLAFPPGTKTKYSNVGYQVLQMIIEQITETSYHEHVATIAKTCNLENTYVPLSYERSANYEADPKLAIGYNLYPNNTYDIPKLACSRCVMGASGIVSSPLDLLKWNNCIWKGKVVSDESIQQMTGYPKYWRVNQDYYGYGIDAIRDKKVLKLYHSGYVYGFLASMAFYPTRDISIIIMENMSVEKGKGSEISQTQDDLMELIENNIIHDQ